MDDRIDFTWLSRTDRNNLRDAYRTLRWNGHDRATAREWVAERIEESQPHRDRIGEAYR
jgi:hypothetical protein